MFTLESNGYQYDYASVKALAKGVRKLQGKLDASGEPTKDTHVMLHLSMAEEDAELLTGEIAAAITDAGGSPEWLGGLPT
jgi:hypothetical protein